MRGVFYGSLVVSAISYSPKEIGRIVNAYFLKSLIFAKYTQYVLQKTVSVFQTCLVPSLVLARTYYLVLGTPTGIIINFEISLPFWYKGMVFQHWNCTNYFLNFTHY